MFGSGPGNLTSNANSISTSSALKGLGIASGSETSGNVKPTVSGNGINSSTSNGESTTRLLKDLLESANNLPRLNNHDLGTINLTPDELQRKSQQLIKNKSDKPNFTKAHYLLASSGISAEEIENELRSIEPIHTNKIVKPKTVGIDQFLNTKKEENILNTIEQSLSLASQDFDEFINKTIKIDWKSKRNELRKNLLNNKEIKPEDKSDVAPLIWKNGNYEEDKMIRNYTRDKFEKYATVIYRLNESRLSNESFPLLSNFKDINDGNSDLKSKQLTEIYKILMELTNESEAKFSQEQSFKDNNKLVVNKSKAFLQHQFFQYVEEIYNKEDNKEEFKPSTNVNKIRFFIKKIVSKSNDNILKVNGLPIWTIIYYLLRSGLYSEVVKFVNDNSDVFNKFDKNFPTYLKDYLKDNKFKLSPNLHERINKEFNQQFSMVEDFKKIDPYKYCIYKIIGKCDLSKKNLPSIINLTIEDWLWFHLSIINEDSDKDNDLIFENYRLINLQKQIISIGVNKLNNSSNNPMYLKCLVLVGLYELAIKYVYEFINEIDGIHLCIGLNYYGLIQVSTTSTKELINLNFKTNNYEVSFSKMMTLFIRSFKISDPKIACQYLILIALSFNGDSTEEIKHCHENLIDLIVISRDFNSLLGKLNHENGEIIPGLLFNQRSLIKLSDVDEFNYKIIEVSGKKCEEEGRIFDCILLYQLCQNFDKVLMIINKLLSELISTTDFSKSLKSGDYETYENNIVLLSQHINSIFNNASILSKINKANKFTTDLLISIVNVRESFISKKFNSLLLEIENLNLLPINVNDDLIKIRSLSEFIQNSLDNNILKVIPCLLIMVMSSISQLNEQTVSSNFKSLSNETDEINRLKVIAKNCMIFAGMIQYKMPRETYSLLVQLESQL